MTIILKEEDFKVKQLNEWNVKYLLNDNRVDVKLQSIWLEVKQKNEDVYEMLAQMIFTAYRIRLTSQSLPPFFGCFNSKIGAVIENSQAQDVFEFTDINWNQTPSKLNKETVATIKNLLKDIKIYPLSEFGAILQHIETFHQLDKKQITKNNFINVYNEWLFEIGNYFANEDIKPDCYLADLMTDGDKTIADKLKIVLEEKRGIFYYEKKATDGLFSKIEIKEQKKYNNFWAKYERPPNEEYQEYILSRRDLLQPYNVREVKGAFFTPRIWANKSKEYLEMAFGANWQDDYYIWDCACGTGNLEAGLVNQNRVFMSTLDESDLLIISERKIMPDSIHFQFDFLNDEWKPKLQGGKIPDKLWNIIKNEPEKLIVYINPPYLEATSVREINKIGKAKKDSTKTIIKSLMINNKPSLGNESNEISTQFYYRIYTEIKNCKIASFSKIKNCCAPNFENFREIFKAKFCGGFLCRAKTFDNVKGKFPISFQIWDCNDKKDFKKSVKFDAFNNQGIFEEKKNVYNIKSKLLINDWFKNNNKNTEDIFAYIPKQGNDFSQQNRIALYQNEPNHANKITKSNLIQSLIYCTIRLAIKSTWLNDRDQFTKPSSKRVKIEIEKLKTFKDVYDYEEDNKFIGNCIVFALFEKNFTDSQLFKNSQIGLVGADRDLTVWDLLYEKRVFSDEAKAVLDTAQELYKIYHKNNNNPNANQQDVFKATKNSDIYNDFVVAFENLRYETQPDVYKYGFLHI